ncbi:hypothetical protein R1sor_015744 [Riccia sorocarpa]|uniref:BTB domain-containing protein n=1 Tax=Riccia sorocarpa TaxID=122646 RepID=A0ABD3HH29_9MARC
MLNEFDFQLRQLVDNVELSDVTFICEDGVRVRGSRGLLAVRSPFFKRLLFGQMMESKESNVDLPTVSSQVLILVMKFLYTGKIVPDDLRSSTSRVLSSVAGHGTLQFDWNFLVKALATTRFLMLDQLGRILLDQLLDDTPQGGAMDIICAAAQDESSIPEFCSSSERTSFVSRIAKTSLKPLLRFVDFTYVPTELLYCVLQPLDVVGPGELAKILRAQAMRNSRRFRKDLNAPEPNVWQLLTSTEDIWRIPTEDDITLRYTVRRETSNFTVAAVASVLNFTVAAGACLLTFDTPVLSWEINLIPRGSLEQQSIANFEVGFIALRCGETVPQDMISPISADSRSSVIRVESDPKTTYVFCEGREVHKWILPNDQFHWRKPFKVTVNRVKRIESYVKNRTGRQEFCFYSAKDKLVYPVIHWKLEGHNQILYRPHYDQLTVEIDC